MPNELNIRADADSGTIQAEWRFDGGEEVPIDTHGAVLDPAPLLKGYPKAVAELTARLNGRDHDQEWLRKYCIGLYSAMFPRALDNELQMRHYLAGRPPIRIRAVLPPEWHRLPWELMYRPDKFPQPYLCLNTWISLVRSGVREDAVPQLAALPLRILVIVCSPIGLQPLSARSEIDSLLNSFGPLIQAGRVAVDFIQGGDTQLRLAVLNAPYHIWHFIGHGEEIRSQVHLLLEGPARERMPISPVNLWGMLPPMSHPVLVILNVCKGAAVGRTAPLNSVAHAFLSLPGMQAVIGHQFDISDAAAAKLTASFYQFIVNGVGVEQALSLARGWISRQSAQGDRSPGLPHYWTEWHTPVLFLNSRMGEVLMVSPGPDPPAPIAADFLATQAQRLGHWAEAASYAREALIIPPRDPRMENLLDCALAHERTDNALDEARYAEGLGNWGEALRNYSLVLDDPQQDPIARQEAEHWRPIAQAGVGVADPLLRWED